MKPLVSIIIPVYQVEKYLDKCIASVINQTYSNLEIILVDDGSFDHCPSICDEWKKRDSRVKVLHQENGGLSIARNIGMKLATGEFIGFVDSDDWIEPNMVELLLSALQETVADIAIGAYDSFPEKPKAFVYPQPKTSERIVYSSEEVLKMILTGEGGVGSYVWNKLYRRVVLLNIDFPEGKLYEDVLWIAKVVGNAKTIVCLNSIIYHYLNRPNSLCHDVCNKIRRVHDELDMIEQRLGYIREHYPSLEKFAIIRVHNFCCREYLENSSNYCQLDADGKIRLELYRHFCQYRPYILGDIKNIGKNIVRILFWISPCLLAKFYNFCNIFRSKNN